MENGHTKGVIIVLLLSACLGCLCGCGKKSETSGSGLSGTTDRQLAELNDATRRYRVEHGPFPTNLEQLVAARRIKSVPTPPPGKRFVIDPKTGIVSLIDL